MNYLQQMLATMATKEEVIKALGLTQEQDEGFWETQLYAVKNRFLSYLLYKLRLDMTLVSGHINDFQMMDLASTADHMLNEGITYAFIRQWWKNMGTYLHNRAFDAKREREKLEKMDIVVLVFFNKGRPLYLSYSGFDMILVEDRDKAFGFPIMSVTDLDKSNMQDAAKDFDAVVKTLGATHVKLLPRQKG